MTKDNTNTDRKTSTATPQERFTEACASVEQNISTFSKFIVYLVNQGMKGKPVAKLPK